MGRLQTFPKIILKQPERFILAKIKVPAERRLSSKKTIIAEDISKDPRWAQYKDIPIAHEFQACSSTPIMDVSGSVLGTFVSNQENPSKRSWSWS
jgi:hypothetical protein